jgi:uncharacterized GH25 family protein
MRPSNLVVALIAAAALVTAGCGGGEPQKSSDEMAMPAPAPSAPAAGAAMSGQNLEITFTTEPDPPKAGENTLDVMVMSGGQPVTDADVSVEFFMAAMPSMNMAEMRNSVPLKHEGAGRYRGAGNVMMAGTWDATVTVKRGGQELGSRKVSITAK